MIDRAEGIYMYDTDGRKIIDGCSGLLTSTSATPTDTYWRP